MKFTQPLHLHVGNILYKYGLNPSLDNNVMNLYLTGYRRLRRTSRIFFAIFSERGGQMFCLYPLYIGFNGIKYCHLFIE